ncbi:MAG: hypothetical protein EOP61_28675 [Sphingomonadales bacterium]|nr:MAG: hypothetical protein EOP61_28675 [Sphingomonadales bacterium]
MLDGADAEGKGADLIELIRVFWRPLFEQTDYRGRHSYARFLAGLERSGMIETRQQVNAEFPETDRVTQRIIDLLPDAIRPLLPNRLRLTTGLVCGALLHIDRKLDAQPEAVEAMFEDAIAMAAAAIAVPPPKET